MIRAPAARPETKPTIREVDKEAREFERGGRGRVFGEFGLIAVCRLSQAAKYLNAPNAERVRARNGTVVAIRLHSFGNDLGHAGEHHGSSVITTRSVQDKTEHKWINSKQPHPYGLGRAAEVKR